MVLGDPRVGNLLPRARIACQRLPELVLRCGGCALEGLCGGGRSSTNRVWKGLVLLSGGCHRLRRREVRALEVSGGEVSDAMPDGRAEL